MKIIPAMEGFFLIEVNTDVPEVTLKLPIIGWALDVDEDGEWEGPFPIVVHEIHNMSHQQERTIILQPGGVYSLPGHGVDFTDINKLYEYVKQHGIRFDSQLDAALHAG